MMKKYSGILILGAILAAFALVPGRAQQGAAAHVHIVLLGTTDIHGNVLPEDYYANRTANRGLAKIETLVKQVRASEPNVLLLDSGDIIEGTPLAYYFARKDTSLPNPTIAAMNAMGYDAAACGNHEFNFGLDVLWKAKREAKFPILAANVKQDYINGVEHFGSFIIKKIGGVRVGIVGFVTPGIPRWEIPAHYKGYEFEQIVESAKKVIPEVRKQADLVVVIAHSGLGADPAANQQAGSDDISGENVMLAVAEQVPGIDVIFFGHTHREVGQMVVNGALMAQARNWGQSLARADVEMERDASGGWRVKEKHSAVIPVSDATAADPEILKVAQPYETATQKYLDTPIATSAQEMHGDISRYQDDPLVDLIHQVQLEAGHADVSLATMFYPALKIPAGPVTVRQLAGLYIYENTLYVVEMTGAQIKEALEHAASFFPQWPFDSSKPLQMPGYNADSAEGVSYVMDLTRPVGDRIRNLTRQGKPLDMAAKLRVAINNYRYTGGGHYDVFKGLPIVYRSPEEVRELIIDYVSRTRTVPTTSDGNWSIQPREAAQALIAEERRHGAPQAAGAPNSFR
ncbi:MAG: 5'-nucleotidase C-terminal domain-containing protein [Candidatus Acidiferrales bacterium]